MKKKGLVLYMITFLIVYIEEVLLGGGGGGLMED